MVTWNDASSPSPTDTSLAATFLASTPIRGLTFAERADAAPPLLERIESAVKTREMRARRRIKARFNQIQAVTRLSISAAESRRPSEGDLAAAAAAAAEVPTPRGADRTGSPTRRGG